MADMNSNLAYNYKIHMLGKSSGTEKNKTYYRVVNDRKYTETGEMFARLSIDERKKLLDLIASDNLDTANNMQDLVVLNDSFYVKYGKRAIDIFISAIALIVSLPINAIIASVTLIDVGFPVLFSQRRVGKNGKIFKLYKFRNMTNDTDEKGVLLPASLRVTKWGRFVRKTSLDELLNFWNVFIGDMSLIGPRPLLEEYEPYFSERHRQRHLIRGGLDCPIHDGKDRTWQNRLENDVWYVQNVSLKTDLFLIGCLIKEALMGNEKEERASGDGGYGAFVGYDEKGNVMDSHHIPLRYFDRINCEKNIGEHNQ